MRGGEICEFGKLALRVLRCGAVRWGGRRRRIKADARVCLTPRGKRGSSPRRINTTCGAHGETQTRVCLASLSVARLSCVSLSPRGKEEAVPRGRRRDSLGTRRSDAEKRKSPGTATGGKKKKEEAAAQSAGTGRQAHKPASRTHAEEATAPGGGGGSRAPGHTASIRPRAHPADTPQTHPRHTRHTPATHPARAADTPLTHPADTPATHPRHTRPATPSRHTRHTPTQPRPRHTPTDAGAGRG